MGTPKPRPRHLPAGNNSPAEGSTPGAPAGRRAAASSPPLAQSPLAQSPLAQSPLAQPPLAQSPLAQSPLAQSPPAQSPLAPRGRSPRRGPRVESTENVMLANLLEEEEWLRRVARGITDDKHLAEDIVQSAYLAAMRSPPRDPARRRAWLRTVVKNFARLSYRESSRRKVRERATARDEAIPSPELLVEENELHGLVAETVAQLSEPYRSTVIKHFYHGRSSSEIATELGIPANTVRVRIRRAVMQLSNTLDRRCDGRRAMWLLPLLGWFLAPARLEALAIEAALEGGSAGGSAAGGSTAAGSAAGGSAGMGSSGAAKIGTAAPELTRALLPVAALALLGWLALPWTSGGGASPDLPASLDGPRANSSLTASLPSNSEAHTSFGPRFDTVPVDSSAANTPPSATSSFATMPRLVQIVDRSTGTPISNAEVFVESFSMVSDRLARGRSRLEYLMQTFAREPVGRTDARGNLEVDPARLARDRMLVRAPGYLEFRERDRLRTSDKDGVWAIDLIPAELTMLELRLPGGSPARHVPLRIVGASGAEIEGATDANGRFEYLVEEGQYAVAIDLLGFAAVRALALPDATITLARAPEHTLVVTDARGLPLKSAGVEVRLADRTVLLYTTDARGTVAFYAADATDATQLATLRVDHPDHPLSQFEIQLNSEIDIAPLVLDDPTWVEGNVRGPDGVVSGGTVLAIPSLPFYVRDLPRALIDAKGHFRLGPLAAKIPVTLRIEGTGCAPKEIPNPDPLPFETQTLEVTLDAGRVIEGRVVTPSGDPLPGVRMRLGAVVGDELRGPLVESDRDGRFRFVEVSEEASPFRPTLKEPRWSALGDLKNPPATGRVLQVLTPHQLLAADTASGTSSWADVEEIPRKFFLGSRNTVSVPDHAGDPSLVLVVAPWPARRMPKVELRDADGTPVRDVLNWVIHPPEDPADVSAIFAGTDGNPVRIGDPTPLEGCWIQFVSENHAVAGGWFWLRDTDEPWAITLWPREERTLYFRHMGHRGGPLEHTDLWWVPEDPDAICAIALGRTDENGTLTVDRLAPGRYRLLIADRTNPDLPTGSGSSKSAAVRPRPFWDAIAIADGTDVGVLEIPMAGGRVLDVRVSREPLRQAATEAPELKKTQDGGE